MRAVDLLEGAASQRSKPSGCLLLPFFVNKVDNEEGVREFAKAKKKIFSTL
jgi:hypothetical protein